MKISPSTHLTYRPTTQAEDAQELQAWQAILADERFSIWRAISVAGEVFLMESARGWAKRCALAWVLLSSLALLGCLIFKSMVLGSQWTIFKTLISISIMLAQLSITVMSLLLWPKLVNKGLAIRQAPHRHELPERRQALALLEQRQHQRAPSLKRAFKQGFGPGVVSVMPLAFLFNVSWLIFLFSKQSVSLLFILIMLFGSLTSFGMFVLIGLLLFSGGGLVVVGKQTLDHRASIKLLQNTDAAEQIGALELAQTLSDDAGALSLSQEPGQLTQLSTTSRAQEMGDGELIVHTPSASHHSP